MKIAALIARILLGLVFLIFGLNGLLSFLPMGPLPGGLAGQFMTAFMQSHYSMAVSAFQVAGAVLLLANRYVPLGITLLGPVIVNILLFHLLLLPTGLPIAIVVAILWALLAVYYRQYFAGLFTQKAAL